MTRVPLIAIVDDADSVRRALARLLTASGFDVRSYSGGADFLDSLTEHMPDCALVDFQMPGLTAPGILEQLTLRGLSLPVIVVTAFNDPALRAQCLAAGAIEYLCKPVGRDDLMAAVNGALGRSSAKSLQESVVKTEGAR